jgi:hypothetical protein
MSFVASKNSQCHFCGKTVYAMEKMDADGKTFHKACFKCEHCQCVLKLGNFAAMGGRYFCKPHFKQLFKEKGNYHSGFGNEDAKSKWAPQAVVYGAPGSNFMKASASEWDSRQTKSFRMPRPRAESDAPAPSSSKASTLTFSADTKPAPIAASVSSAPSSPQPTEDAALSSSPQSNSAPTSPAPSVGGKSGDFKPPRESLAQLASVGALKSVGERWGSTSGPAAGASRDQRRRAALEARKVEEKDSPAPAAEPEKAATVEQAEETQEESAPQQSAAAAESKTVDELKAELEQERSKFASERAAFEDAKHKFEEEKKIFEEQRSAFDAQQNAFQEERKQWAESHPSEDTPAATAEVQA